MLFLFYACCDFGCKITKKNPNSTITAFANAILSSLFVSNWGVFVPILLEWCRRTSIRRTYAYCLCDCRCYAVDCRWCCHVSGFDTCPIQDDGERYECGTREIVFVILFVYYLPAGCGFDYEVAAHRRAVWACRYAAHPGRLHYQLL